VILSKVDYQIYIELIGKGGSGKSTFINLITALIGRENIVVTDIKKLETNKFETANLKDKKLIVINDTAQYRGKVSVLKNIIGLDLLRYEEKMKQPGASFLINGLVIISSNELLQLGDLTSGINRRRIVLFFNRKPTKIENLITLEGDHYEGLFVNELNLLFLYCLNLDVDLVDRIMRNPLNLPLLKDYFFTN
jgi:phage/plasmid-associated DNA primase